MILRDGVTHGDSLGDFRDAYFPGVFTPNDGVQNDGINYWEYETSASAIEQANTAFNGHYEIVPDVEAFVEELGRAHVLTPVTNAQLVCRILLEKKKNQKETN